ncbi:MAG: hypothetical protein KKH92_09895 [Firmicutes bacterium]|nr:hypothetical protein [Bacillota bacterium]
MGNNVCSDGTIVYNSPNEIIKGQPLKDKFESLMKMNGFTLMWVNKKNAPSEFELSFQKHQTYRIVAYLKCVSEAGWSDKPSMKRVQVSNVRLVDNEKYIDTNFHQTNLILGIYFFRDNVIMVGWDAYKYVYHNKNRSCYVDIDALKLGTVEGFHQGEVSKQKVWVFTPNNFKYFLDSYIKYNNIES